MARINLIQLAKDYDLHIEVITCPLIKGSKPFIKMWLDPQIDPILTAYDEPNTYIHVARCVTTKLVNGKLNFFDEVMFYNDKANDQWVRDQLTKIIGRYEKRLTKLKGK